MIRFDHDNIAVRHGERSISYAELGGFVTRYRSLLDLEAGAKVAICSENRPEWFFALLGAWDAGAVVVPIDFMSVASDIAYILDDCRPEVLFCSRACSTAVHEGIAQVADGYAPRVLLFEELPQEPLERQGAMPELEPNATALIMYTSGTTGGPKGVMLSFDNLLVNIESVTQHSRIYTARHRVMQLLPSHHILPLVGTILAPLSVGATVVICPALTSEAILETMQTHAITMMIGVPRLYAMIAGGIQAKIEAKGIGRIMLKLARRVNSPKFSRKVFKQVHDRMGGHLVYMVSGGAALDPKVGEFLRTLGFDVLEGFGMTETAPMITFPRPGHVRPGACGQAMPTNEVKIVDGEVWNRGRNVMQGYYNRPRETAEAVQGGWLRTGDLGYLDEDGYLFITGRKKEMIILPNGKNINPEEVERVLIGVHPAVKEAAVFLDGSGLHALVRLDLGVVMASGKTADELLRWDVVDAFNNQVTPYKRILRYTRMDDELPRSRLGKLQRFKLQEVAEAIRRRNERGASEPEPDSEEYREIKEFLEALTKAPVHPAAHIEADLALDSLDRVSFLVFLQKTFGVEVNEEVIRKHPTVVRLAEYIGGMKVRINSAAVNWGEFVRERVQLQLPRSGWTHLFLKKLGRGVLGLYFRLRGEGMENVPEGPCIIVPNHQSFLDGLFVAVFLKDTHFRQTFFYAKEEHVRKPWLKRLAAKTNVIVMDINLDLKESIQKLAQVLKEGRKVIIFPEGTRTRDGNLGPFKKTFAILSRELNIPVVPVAIRGAFSAMPTGKKIPRPWKKVDVRFLEPVVPDQENYDQFCERVRGLVASSIV